MSLGYIKPVSHLAKCVSVYPHPFCNPYVTSIGAGIVVFNGRSINSVNKSPHGRLLVCGAGAELLKVKGNKVVEWFHLKSL